MRKPIWKTKSWMRPGDKDKLCAYTYCNFIYMQADWCSFILTKSEQSFTCTPSAHSSSINTSSDALFTFIPVLYITVNLRKIQSCRISSIFGPRCSGLKAWCVHTRTPGARQRTGETGNKHSQFLTFLQQSKNKFYSISIIDIQGSQRSGGISLHNI